MKDIEWIVKENQEHEALTAAPSPDDVADFGELCEALAVRCLRLGRYPQARWYEATGNLYRQLKAEGKL